MKLSIIIPVYNVEEHLVRCIKSVVAQKLTDYEIIIVDDGSTDHSTRLCDELQFQHPTIIKVIHQANGGLSAARNTGIDVAQGQYITFVDSDDELCPDTLKANLDFLTEHPEVNMLEYPVEVHADSSQAYHLTFADETLSCNIFSDWICRQGYLHCYAWNKIYRAHLWHQQRFPIGEYYEDSAVMPHIISQCHSIHYSSHGCYRYIMHEGSITTNYHYVKQRQLFVNSHQIYLSVKNHEVLHTHTTMLWIYCLNLLIDAGRCKDIDSADYQLLIKEMEGHRPRLISLLRVAIVNRQFKLIPLSLLGLRAYLRFYTALKKKL